MNLAVHQVWRCDDCRLEARTVRAVRNRMHDCPRKGGLSMPMVPVGTRAKVEVVEREDYLGQDAGRVTTYQTGFLRRPRPAMATVVTRDTGQDTFVYAPRADARVSLEHMTRLTVRERFRHFQTAITGRAP